MPNREWVLLIWRWQKKPFTSDPVSAIQGENDGDRHLAIARKVLKDGAPLAVVV